MDIFRIKEMDKIANVDKYEIVSVDREGIYRAQKRHGKKFDPELANLIEKLLDGDYTVTPKILNMPMPKLFGKDLYGIKKCFETKYVESLPFSDYNKAVKFFNTRLPGVPVEVDSTLNLYSGFYYTAEDTRLVKYGVKLDTERLVNIKVHIMAMCETKTNASLIIALNRLLINGDYTVVPEIFSIINGSVPCNCPDGYECAQYFSAIRSAIKVEEYVSLSNEDYRVNAKFMNLDCPEDLAPIKPITREDEEVRVPEETEEVPTTTQILDLALSDAREKLNKAIADGNQLEITKYDTIVKQLEEEIRGHSLPEPGKQI